MKKLLDGLENVLKYISYVLFIGICLIVFIQVFCRYVLSTSLIWTEQASRYTFIWVCMLYMPIIVRKKLNLAFDVISKSLPAKIQKLVEIVGNVGIVFLAIYWCYWAYRLCEKFTGRLVSAINIPYNVFYSAQVVGSALLFIFAVDVVITDIKMLCSAKEVTKT